MSMKFFAAVEQYDSPYKMARAALHKITVDRQIRVGSALLARAAAQTDDDRFESWCMRVWEIAEQIEAGEKDVLFRVATLPSMTSPESDEGFEAAVAEPESEESSRFANFAREGE